MTLISPSKNIINLYSENQKILHLKKKKENFKRKRKRGRREEEKKEIKSLHEE